MLKNPICPQCENNDRVIAHYKWATYICNKCKTTFHGNRITDTYKQVDNQNPHDKVMEKMAKMNKLAEEKSKENEINT